MGTVPNSLSLQGISPVYASQPYTGQYEDTRSRRARRCSSVNRGKIGFEDCSTRGSRVARSMARWRVAPI